MQKKYNIKIADRNDQDFLYEMLYQSIYVEPNSSKPDRKKIETPEISKYVANWGKQGDYALIAIDENEDKIGAVWLRYFDDNNKGYGFISDQIPEIGIAVEQESRGNGIGSFLLEEILKRTKMKIQSISLSVQPNNPALKLFRRFGFYECGKEEDGGSVIMKYDNNA